MAWFIHTMSRKGQSFQKFILAKGKCSMRGCDHIFSVVLAASYQERWFLTLLLWHSTQEKYICLFINLIIHLENTWIVSLFYINIQWMKSTTTKCAFCNPVPSPRKEDDFLVQHKVKLVLQIRLIFSAEFTGKKLKLFII